MKKAEGKKSTGRRTQRQARFVEAMADPDVKNQSEAAIKAGFPEEHAAVTASQLLTNPNILAAIEKRKEEMAQYANVHANMVLGGTALRATASIDDALDERGCFDIEKARQTGVIHQIKRITRTPNKYGEAVAIELYGKDAAQDKLGCYLGLDKLPAENPMSIRRALDAFNIWIEKNPHANLDERLDAIKAFANGTGVDAERLAQDAGVQVLSEASQ